MRVLLTLLGLVIGGAAAHVAATAQAPADSAQAPADSAKAAEDAPASGRTALLIPVRGAIGPATSHFIAQGLKKAAEEGHALVILQMDTPGGLDTAMRDIIKDILASPVPVVTYVAPNGARAASAGTYILYASHVAAMAPATNVGSATPVSIGGEPPKEPGEAREAPEDDEGEKDAERGKDRPAAGEKEAQKTPQPGSAMERKVINDAVGYIRSLAELRGRNADWAERAVREGVNLQASAALEQNVIDVIAEDVEDLLAKIHGRKVKIGTKETQIASRGLAIERHEPDWRTELLSILTNPTVAYGLLLIGLYGLMFEGYNPGAVLPGVAGAICLLLALFAFQILPINYAGLALIGLGIVLVIAEAFVPSFGTLGLGGLIAFVIGSIMLFDNDVPGFQVARPVIGGIAVAGGLLLVGSAWLFNRARRRPVVTGAEQMVGTRAEAISDFTPAADGALRGSVRISGEIWNARSTVPVAAGRPVRVVRMDGLTLTVEPLTPSSGSHP